MKAVGGMIELLKDISERLGKASPEGPERAAKSDKKVPFNL